MLVDDTPSSLIMSPPPLLLLYVSLFPPHLPPPPLPSQALWFPIKEETVKGSRLPVEQPNIVAVLGSNFNWEMYLKYGLKIRK